MSVSAPRIFSSLDFSEEQLARLRAAVPDASVRQFHTKDTKEVNGHIGDAEVAIIYGHQAFDPKAAPELRWVQTASAGVEQILGSALWESDAIIVNASGVAAPSIAEQVVAVVLALRHRLPYILAKQKEHVWAWAHPEARSMGELAGLTLGILGYGSIGREVGRLGKALGMRILATTIDAKLRKDSGYTIPGTGDPDGLLVDELGGPDFQTTVVAESDVIVVAVPSTPKTRHLVAEKDFRAMKSTAIFVNVARGTLVDEAALLRALQENWIAGAALDVFAVEPLPENSPLWDLENVLITPHLAAESPDYWQRLMTLFITNLQREQEGLPLLNVVNRELGF